MRGRGWSPPRESLVRRPRVDDEASVLQDEIDGVHGRALFRSRASHEQHVEADPVGRAVDDAPREAVKRIGVEGHDAREVACVPVLVADAGVHRRGRVVPRSGGITPARRPKREATHERVRLASARRRQAERRLHGSGVRRLRAQCRLRHLLTARQQHDRSRGGRDDHERPGRPGEPAPAAWRGWVGNSCASMPLLRDVR